MRLWEHFSISSCVSTHTQTWYRVTLVELKQTSFIYIYAYKTISKTSSLSCYMMLVHYQKRSFSNCLVFSILLDWHPTLLRHTHIYILWHVWPMNQCCMACQNRSFPNCLKYLPFLWLLIQLYSYIYIIIICLISIVKEYCYCIREINLCTCTSIKT